MRRSRWIPIGTALLLSMLVASVAGCSCTPQNQGGAVLTTASPVASGTAETSAAAGATTTAGSKKPGSNAATGGAGKPLTGSEARAIEAELTAIQRELDRLSLPSDKDFGGIESGLK